MRFFLTFLLAMTIQICHAQDLLYKNYEWEKNPVLTQLDDKDSVYKEIILFEKKATEINFGTDGNVYEYYLYHQITKVLSDQSIEKNNKIYLPNNLELLTFKVRTISPDGKIRELNNKDIIESEETNGKKYKYVALQGIEKGSEVEQIIYLKLNPRLSGSVQYAQGSVYKRKYQFEVISPSHLTFKFKSLNNYPEMVQDSTITDKNVYRSSHVNIPPIKGEKYARLNPYKMGVLYKIKDNKTTGVKNVYNYNRVTETVYNSIYGDFAKNKKALGKYIKTLGFSNSDSELKKILAIERALKTDRIVFKFDFMSNNMSQMLKSRLASTDQMVKMMGQLFEYLEIDHQIVLTCDRFEYMFDKEFESYNFLESYLIYFPAHKLFISPTELLSRSKYIPYELYNNFGLFLSPVKVANYKTAVGKIQFIDALADTCTTDTLVLHCHLTDNMEELAINYTRSVSGYYAKSYQPIYQYLDTAEITEMNLSYPSFLTDKKEEISDVIVKNTDKNDFPYKPLITSATVKSERYIEEAGDKILIKFGELIGPQAELYQEGKRDFPVENNYNHLYVRKLSFTIPDGYTISNPNDMNFDVVHTDEQGNKTMGFTSSYKINGKTLELYCEEYYRQISYPIDQFDYFRKVINAAADFNKVKLILVKE